jgi:hypothetical protein
MESRGDNPREGAEQGPLPECGGRRQGGRPQVVLTEQQGREAIE